jgi:hypothetical protein
MDQIRQGDVCIVRIKGRSKRGKIVAPTKDGRNILAFGEVTGHHHRFHGPSVQLFRDEGSGGATMVEVKEPTALVHEEHAPITVAPGRYRQLHQVEYSPKAIQRVAD